MKEAESQDKTMQQITDNWITPEITILSVKEETLGDLTISDDHLGDGSFS